MKLFPLTTIMALAFLCLASPMMAQAAPLSYNANITGSDTGSTSFCLCLAPNNRDTNSKVNEVHYCGTTQTFSSVTNACHYTFSAGAGTGCFQAGFTDLTTFFACGCTNQAGIDFFTCAPQTFSSVSCVSGTYCGCPAVKGGTAIRSCWVLCAGPASYTAHFTDPGQVTVNLTTNAGTTVPEPPVMTILVPLLGLAWWRCQHRA